MINLPCRGASGGSPRRRETQGNVHQERLAPKNQQLQFFAD